MTTFIGTLTRGTTRITPELPLDAAGLSNSLSDKIPTGPDVVLGASPTAAQINAAILANPNSKIIIPAGSTITGQIMLAKAPGAGWTWLCSSNPSPEGTVMTPAAESTYAPPVVISPLGDSGIIGAETAGQVPYKFVVKDIVVRPNNTTESGSTKALIKIRALNDGNAGINMPISNFPPDIYFSSVAAKGYPAANINGGFYIRARRFGLRGCVATEIHDSNAIDAAGFQLLDSPGPYIIEDWICSATGEPFEAGGTDSDLNCRRVGAQGGIIRRGVSFKPSWWKAGGGAGFPQWTIKNGFLEFKTGDQVLIEDIVSDYCWSSAQAGGAAQFWSVNQSGTQPWARMRNITLRRMWIRNHPVALRFPMTGLGSGAGDSIAPLCMSMKDVVCTGLGDAITRYTDGSSETFLIPIAIKNDSGATFAATAFGPSELELRNITMLTPSGKQIIGILGGGKMRNFQVHSNIFGGAADSYYATFNSYAAGDSLWTSLVTGASSRWAKNLIAGSHAANRINVGTAGNDYRVADSNLNLASYTRAYDVNCTLAQLDDLKLNAGDPMKGQGDDGKDPGADIDAIQAGVNTIWTAYTGGGF